MQLIIVQHDIAWEQRDKNLKQVGDAIRGAKPARGSLLVLPEMFAAGFSMNVAAIAEDSSKPTERFLTDLARELDVNIVAGVINKSSSGKGLNQSLAVSQTGSILARYTKMHPYMREREYFEAGSEIVTFKWNDFTHPFTHPFIVAPFVCYDLRFPEIFRLAAKRGANLFTVIASWPDTRIEHWRTLLRARAIENQAYVIGVNRVGDDPTPLHYPGRSLIVDPLGKVLVDAGDSETLVGADVSIEQVISLRDKFPSLRDMKSI